MFTRKETKVKEIIEFFKFEDLDDATNRLHEAILHYKQERLPEPEHINKGKFKKCENITNIVYEEIKKANKRTVKYFEAFVDFYEKPLVHCGHFAYLLRDIGKAFGHSCHVVECSAEYIQNWNHILVYDKTEEKYRDASTYKQFFCRKGLNGMWFPTKSENEEIIINHLDMTDVPEDMISDTSMLGE